jgi:hypothetical protein
MRFIRSYESKNYVVFVSDGSDGIPEFVKLYLAKDDPKAAEEELNFEYQPVRS